MRDSYQYLRPCNDIFIPKYMAKVTSKRTSRDCNNYNSAQASDIEMQRCERRLDYRTPRNNIRARRAISSRNRARNS
jgi:hypothetical protein